MFLGWKRIRTTEGVIGNQILAMRLLLSHLALSLRLPELE
jgi:hypothetical protein